MAQGTLEQVEEKILELLKNSNVSTIAIVGKPGIGKTWIARKVHAHAIQKGLFDVILWAYLNRKYDKRALYESIAHQMSLLSTSKEWESDDIEEVKEEKEETFENLEQKITDALAEKSLLLILDDEGSKMNEEEIMALLTFPCKKNFKLITSINEDGRHKSTDRVKVIEVPLWSTDKSLSILKQRAGAKVFELQGMERLAGDFITKNMRLTPIATVMLAKALSYKGHGSAVKVLEHALEESSGDGNYSFEQLVCSGYDEVPDGLQIDFCWQGSHFFRDRGSIHFSELIAYWILEGYLGDIDDIEKAYEEGHHILMELIDCQMLKKVEGGYIVMERAILHLDERHRSGFGRTASLGLANVLDDGRWDGIGRITQADGMMKSFHSGNKKPKFSALLLDGNRLSKEVPKNSFESQQDLQVLALFNPRLKSLPVPSSMNKLNVLVLRGGNLLVDIKPIQELKNLSVLEISGASSLENIPDDIFIEMTHLRSLNLSALQIKELPSSFYKLIELRWLILKGCSCLNKMQSLKSFSKLMVLNLSGVSSLENFPEKNLRPFKELQTLDLANTIIRTVPVLHEISALTHLSLSECHRLGRLPSLQSLTNLQVLDLSGSSINEFHDQSLDRNGDLKILDLSRTAISCLPSSFSNLRHLYLKDCLLLKELKCSKSLKDLETLDLSGATSLENIEDELFEDLKNLQLLNISDTKIKSLPTLSTLRNLRQLSLSRCSNLVKLPILNSLSKLEVLDVSGCNALTALEDESFEQLSRLERLNLSGTNIERLPSLSNLSDLQHLSLSKCTKLQLVIEPLSSLKNLRELNLSGISSLTRADFLEHMSHLCIIDLSETLVEELPSMSNLKNLVRLYLRDCHNLKTIPGLDALKKIEILDISGTAIRNLPSLTNFSNLCQLLLRDCLDLEDLENLGNLSGSIIEELSNGISELTQLEHLYLPKVSSIGADARKIQCLPVEHWSISTLPGSAADNTGPSSIGADARKIQSLPVEQWGISNLPGSVSGNTGPFRSVSNSEFFELLEKNPLLWETSFKKFHFSVRPLEEQNKIGGIYLYQDELFFRDIYFKARHFTHFKKEGRSLEIHGFHNLPNGIEIVLSRAKYVFLFDNSFIKRLSELGANNMEVMMGCWIERCTNMESVFHVEDTATMEINLEILWVSYAIKLKSIYGGNLQYKGFRNLKCLYLDCCPKLPYVFSSSQLPEKLEILHIKFCDNMETLFEPTSEECKLGNLHTLHLWELQKLTGIRCELPLLQSLEVGECPMLVNTLFVHQLPKNLGILKIKSCDKLKTLFEPKTSADDTLPNLHTLHLWRLPELMKIGVKLPSVQVRNVELCLKLDEEQ